ncbi:MAG: histidine phosphatase family protein [Polyangiales bacterium]
MTILLARHGETDWNLQGRMQGRLGATLNARGRAQAAALARAARSLSVRAVVCSSLPRAVETATVVAREMGLACVPCDALQEIDFGACTGLTEAEIAQRYPTLHAERRADKWNHRWPGGESYADAASRLRRAVERGELPGEAGTLLIAHQSVNRALSHILSRRSPEEMLQMAQRSDVLLRFEDGAMDHAVVPEEERPALVWLPGPYLAGKANLN